jgi:DNA-binding response OmpR family regulator
MGAGPGGAAHVLVIDRDRDIADLVVAVLSDEGYAVSSLYSTDPRLVSAAVARSEPDCVLLDAGGGGVGYGSSWERAAWMSTRERRVPVIMFTADVRAAAEGRAEETERSRDAQFAAVVAKPFSIDVLLDAVERALARPIAVDRAAASDEGRTEDLVRRLRALGARDIELSKRREWVTFRTADEELFQLYWWQGRGAYLVARYVPSGTMEQVGAFHDLESALACAAELLHGDVVHTEEAARH